MRYRSEKNMEPGSDEDRGKREEKLVGALPAAWLYEAGVLRVFSGAGELGDEHRAGSRGGGEGALGAKANRSKKTASYAGHFHAGALCEAGPGCVLRSFERASLAGTQTSTQKAQDDIFRLLDEAIPEPGERVHSEFLEPVVGKRYNLHLAQRRVRLSEPHNRRVFEKDRGLLSEPRLNGDALLL